MMNEFQALRKSQREKLVQSGAVKRVAEKTGKHRGTVSRTLAGITKNPDVKVVRALRRELRIIARPQLSA
jgi:transcriptional regulator with XRE-family HTH domain